MVSIARACDLVGVARSTLLYYERIGIIAPAKHPDNGYREYSDEDIHALILIRQLQKAGFSLKEADMVMKGRLDPDIILARYHALEKDIRELMAAREMVKSLAARATGRLPESGALTHPAGQWHAELEKKAGKAHEQWLKRLGFNNKEQFYIRWVTRNMTDSEGYMKDFFRVFEAMERQGPGSSASTARGFNLIPDHQGIANILEIGCGKGRSSLTLAGLSQARITSVDNHQPFLDALTADAAAAGTGDRIEARNADMADMDFKPASFDLIWSEGSAYFMGFKKALAEWNTLLRPGGHIFVSDAIWLKEQPSAPIADYFGIEYPAMTTADIRKQEARDLGYRIAGEFILPEEDWLTFYDDMEACVREAETAQGPARAFDKMKTETKVGRKYLGEYGSLCLLLTPNACCIPSAHFGPV